MPIITLPDGSKREFDADVTVYQVAADIGPGLAKAALAGRVNGELVDTSYIINSDSELSLITERDDEGLEVIRHSCAHLLAQAVQSLFPKAQVTIGPVIDNGFFYDFAFSRPFTPDDLEAIEKKMAEIAKQDLPVERSTMTRDEASKFFSEMGESYKAEIIESIPEGEELSLYRQGDFIDLCRGPHVPSTGKIKAFKLMKLAGAYWRGDSNNEMLQRIYGTCWASKKDLKKYLFRLEEAEKRDHRKIGKQLELFHFQEDAPGMVFWHANGWSIFKELERYIRIVTTNTDYQEVKTPQIMDRSLWEKSGHWDKYHDGMFSTESENRVYAIKPMNCPGHIQIFNQGLKSYRDLPLRMAEFGSCHRNEPSGSLHGLMRVRAFTQDDAHVFCTEDQVQDEVCHLIDTIYNVYADFGFENIEIKLSTRPEKRVGSDESWDQAEEALKASLESKNIDYELLPGEGAFYGPKIEFSLRDCLDRVWQCGTVQLDFSMPGRLDAEYVSEDGSKKTPVMIHRAILGSLERFIGILIEEYAGKFPTWLAPIQAVIMNITDKQAEFVQKSVKILKTQGFRVNSDLRNEKIGFKIRQHTLQRVPYLLVVGDREVETGTVSVRSRAGKDLGSMSLDEFQLLLKADIKNLARKEAKE
ncbi:MAG: threonine--tRNA ligase [Gammaproteobacteria bacterium]|nr:MAG: threonine--tRNA ligase [Gammaproteobacteria bacterium]